MIVELAGQRLVGFVDYAALLVGHHTAQQKAVEEFGLGAVELQGQYRLVIFLISDQLVRFKSSFAGGASIYI